MKDTLGGRQAFSSSGNFLLFQKKKGSMHICWSRLAALQNMVDTQKQIGKTFEGRQIPDTSVLSKPVKRPSHHPQIFSFVTQHVVLFVVVGPPAHGTTGLGLSGQRFGREGACSCVQRRELRGAIQRNHRLHAYDEERSDWKRHEKIQAWGWPKRICLHWSHWERSTLSLFFF